MKNTTVNISISIHFTHKITSTRFTLCLKSNWHTQKYGANEQKWNGINLGISNQILVVILVWNAVYNAGSSSVLHYLLQRCWRRLCEENCIMWSSFVDDTVLSWITLSIKLCWRCCFELNFIMYYNLMAMLF